MRRRFLCLRGDTGISVGTVLASLLIISFREDRLRSCKHKNMHVRYPVAGARVLDDPIYLPEELVQQVAGYLPVDDFISMSMVSRETQRTFQKFHTLQQKQEAVSRFAVNHILQSGAHCLLTGPAGTGKTYTLRLLYERARKAGKKIYMTATTALAASGLPEGTTLHSCLHIPVGNQKRRVSKAARKADIIVIDEVSMLSAELLELIEFCICEDRHRTDTMGGVQLVFCGDFYQLPPVSGRPCVRSRLWKALKVHTLHMACPVRQAEDINWFHLLNHIRTGIPPKYYLELFLRRYQAFNIDKHVRGEYGPLLVSTNKQRTIYNAKCLKKRDAEIEDISASDSVYMKVEKGQVLVGGMMGQLVGNNGRISPNELTRLLERGDKVCRLPKTLQLQVGAMYTHLANTEHLYNGSTLIYMGNSHGGFLFRDISNNSLHLLSKTTVTVQLSEKMSFEREQLPVDLGYALTFHRSQGMTLEKAAIDARGIFQQGQLYSGCSRIKTLAGLSLVGFEAKAFRKNPEADAIYENMRKEELCSKYIECT